ncbi:MAG: NAD(P)-dependent oxidoreductase [DPANN group archaeon]|nr:NAD(P)-dependent oxidoreductase [DPANN group archaeon]
MKIALTGATGFLGSHIVEQLVREGHEIILLKRSNSDVWRVKQFLDTCIAVDLDKTSLSSLFADHAIDTIIHAATVYGRHDEKKETIYAANYELPIKLLELAIEHRVPWFINIDTFFNKQIGPVGYLNHYVLSKRRFIEEGKEKVRKSNTKIINLVVEHMYGPKDAEDKFIPQVIKQLLTEQDVKLTEAKQKRDFIFVKEVAGVISFLLDRLESIPFKDAFVTYEIGTGECMPVREFVKLLKQATNSKSKLFFGAIPSRGKEMEESVADPAGLRALGWKSIYSREESMNRTIDSYR